MSATPLVIAQRYALESRLGVGGMSTVHLAFDRRLERQVAIKLLAEHLVDDPAFVSRFRREALAAARLVHPNVVQVFDFGYDEDAHHHFIVMEHIAGSSCAELLRDQGHLPVPDAVDVLVQACRGLDYAHRHGVVHRDVKPGNLLRSDDGVVKLADFGIAKAAEQSSITQVGSVLGTAAYLAPEQARGEEAGPLADLYSLGVVAYQLVGGRLPYQATSLSELALKQQNEPPPRLDELTPVVPPGLATAVGNALALDPEARPGGALALADELEAGARGEEVEDATAATSALGPDGTAATGLLAREDVGATRPVRTSREGTGPRRLQPRPGERRSVPPPPRGAPSRAAERSAARAAGAGAPSARPRRRRLRRSVALLVLLLVLLAGAAAVIAQSGSSDGVKLRQVAGQKFQQVYDDIRGLIDDNTK